jgi:DNA-binding CsgD family transcriptional regulator
MVTDKIKELEAARAKLASLEQSIAEELNKELAGLPAKFGFGSTADFVNAVYSAAGGSAGSAGGGSGASAGGGNGRRRRGRKPGRPAGAGAAAAKSSAGRKRRKRAVITDETRAQVKKMVNDGKTGGEIAKSLGISLPSVQNIKKALGLVKNR